MPSVIEEKAAKAAEAFKAAKALFNSVDFQDCMAVFEENTALKQEIQTLKAGIQGQSTVMADLSQKAEELKKVSQNNKALSDELSKTQHELDKARKNMDAKEKELKKKLEDVNEKLTAEQKERQRLAGFFAELIPMSDDVEDNEILQRLNRLFFSAYILAEELLGTDLPPAIFSQDEIWNALKAHPAVGNKIPLPRSSSPEARLMRVGSFLAILSYELRNHIFQPIFLAGEPYIESKATGLWRLLDDLIEDDPDWEAMLRAALLAASRKLEKAYPSQTKHRINVVVDTLTNLINPLLPSNTKEKFKTKLTAFCAEAHEQWTYIQRLEDRITPTFKLQDSDNPHDTWKPLTLNSHFKSSSSPNSKLPRSHSQTKPKDKQTPSDTKFPPPNSNSSQLPLHAAATDPVPVWPAFYNKALASEDILMPGYFLTAEHVASAKIEEKTLTQAQRRRYSSRGSSGDLSGLVGAGDAGNGAGGAGGGAGGMSHREKRKRSRAMSASIVNWVSGGSGDGGKEKQGQGEGTGKGGAAGANGPFLGGSSTSGLKGG